MFKEENQTTQIGFSDFAELRLRECVLADSRGTHTVCICTRHQNVKLMIDASHPLYAWFDTQTLSSRDDVSSRQNKKFPR